MNSNIIGNKTKDNRIFNNTARRTKDKKRLTITNTRGGIRL